MPKKKEAWELLGLSEKICPTCKSHLAKTGICLNACHLGEAGQKRFNLMMKTACAKTDHPMSPSMEPDAVALRLGQKLFENRLPIEEHLDLINKLAAELRHLFYRVAELSQAQCILAAQQVHGYADLLADAHEMHQATVDAVTKLDIAAEMGYKK